MNGMHALIGIEMTEQGGGSAAGTLAALTKDSSKVLSTNIGWLTTVCHSNCRDLNLPNGL